MPDKKTLLPLLLILLTAAVALATSSLLSVQVRSGSLRAKPSFLGKITASVTYGDRLTVLTEQGGWTQVRDADGHQGWIHTSALTEKKIKLQAGQGDVATGTSGDELALAGKGFSDEVETAYKAQNPDLDYSWVDRMETFRVTAEEARKFLAAGSITSPGGE